MCSTMRPQLCTALSALVYPVTLWKMKLRLLQTVILSLTLSNDGFSNLDIDSLSEPKGSMFPHFSKDFNYSTTKMHPIFQSIKRKTNFGISILRADETKNGLEILRR